MVVLRRPHILSGTNERLQHGSGCSKLSTLLVNVSLKFQWLISEIHQYFLSKKGEKSLQASLIFSKKNISVFGY